MKSEGDGWHFYKIPEAWLNFSWDRLDRDGIPMPGPEAVELTKGKDGVWRYAPKVLND